MIKKLFLSLQRKEQLEARMFEYLFQINEQSFFVLENPSAIFKLDFVEEVTIYDRLHKRLEFLDYLSHEFESRKCENKRSGSYYKDYSTLGTSRPYSTDLKAEYLFCS